MVISMSETINSADFAWAMAQRANVCFDAMQQATDETERGSLATEFNTLQAMAGVVMASSASPFAKQTYEDSEGTDEAERQKLLAAPIDESISHGLAASFGLVGNTRTRTLNSLRKENVQSLRDMLIVGSKQVNDMRNIGERAMLLFNAAIQLADSNLDWPVRPDPRYAATLCTSMDQVPARAFGSCFNLYSGIDTLADIIRLGEADLIDMLSQEESISSTNPMTSTHNKRQAIYAFAEIFRNEVALRATST